MASGRETERIKVIRSTDDREVRFQTIRRRHYKILVRMKSPRSQDKGLNESESIQSQDQISLSNISKRSSQQVADSKTGQRLSSHKSVKVLLQISSCKASNVNCIKTATLMAVLSLIFAQICHCDSDRSTKKPTPMGPNWPKATDDAATSSSSGSGASQTTLKSSQKDHLISTLSDSIERQHFKINPIRAFTRNQRPSKFDSGDYSSDSFISLAPSLNSGFATKGGQSTGGPSNKKADDGMRHILKMHERANQQHQHSATDSIVAAHNLQVSNLKPDQSSAETPPATGSWRAIVKNPTRVASSIISQPSKIVSQIVSYISPLISSKLKVGALSSTSPYAAPTDPVTKKNHTSGLLRARALNTFVGRANSQKPSPVVPSRIESNYKNFAMLRPSVTSSPQSSFLVRPDDVNLRGEQHQYAVTQPTTSIINDYGHGRYKSASSNSATKSTMSSSSSSKKSDLPTTDLMADSSFESSATAMANEIYRPMAVAMKITSSNGDRKSTGPPAIKNEPNKLLDEVSQSKSAPPRAESSGGGGNRVAGGGGVGGASGFVSSWLKRHNHDQKTQSYLQESLRSLLALSQLPILSGGPVSTAPSVLERGGRLHGLNKTSSSATSQEQSQSLRAIDELLRFAYILSTGVRRKRDPLKALATKNPNSVLLASASNHHHHNHLQEAGRYNQRSIKRLLSPSGRNLTSSLDYAKGLRQILRAGLPKNAKPRGVMWDMATDPSLAVTVFHLLERASVALPLGFLLMPFVHMIRNPLNGFDLGRILPARASHRSVDYEELAKRLDIVDKMLSRAMRPTHREAFMGK